MKNNKNGSGISWSDTEAGRQVQARLSDEHTLEAIDHLLARIDTLEKAVDELSMLMHQGPGLVAMAGDMLDEGYREANAKGIDLDERIKNALTLAEKLTAPEMVARVESLNKLSEQLPGMVAMMMDIVDEKIRTTLEHGFDPSTLSHVAGVANTALTNAKAEPRKRVGIFGVFKALNDPDRQKGLGFLLSFLKHFGKGI
jgi:uncharacterized protein YjgD (DUF1641 family)